MNRVVCCNTGAEFPGTEGEARAAGWMFGRDGWESPPMGWERDPRRPAPISVERVEYAGGVDWR